MNEPIEHTAYKHYRVRAHPDMFDDAERRAAEKYFGLAEGTLEPWTGRDAPMIAVPPELAQQLFRDGVGAAPPGRRLGRRQGRTK